MANKKERIDAAKSVLKDYVQELNEIQDYAPNVSDIFYSKGQWIIAFYIGNNEYFDTKYEAIQRLRDESKAVN